MVFTITSLQFLFNSTWSKRGFASHPATFFYNAHNNKHSKHSRHIKDYLAAETLLAAWAGHSPLPRHVRFSFKLHFWLKRHTWNMSISYNPLLKVPILVSSNSHKEQEMVSRKNRKMKHFLNKKAILKYLSQTALSY